MIYSEDVRAKGARVQFTRYSCPGDSEWTHARTHTPEVNERARFTGKYDDDVVVLYIIRAGALCRYY